VLDAEADVNGKAPHCYAWAANKCGYTWNPRYHSGKEGWAFAANMNWLAAQL
jgi:hypothetical protein